MAGAPVRWMFSTRRIVSIAAVVSCLFAALPSAALADLTVGEPAVIADANGDAVRLRDQPSAEGAILASFPEGTAVQVLDGPLVAGDGSLWYRVAVNGLDGYMTALYLAATAAPPAEDAPPAESSAEATGAAVIVNTNGDPIFCRTDPSYSGAIVVELWEGESVELLGPAWGAWQPVRCGGQDGFVHVDYLGGVGGPAIGDPPIVKTPTPAASEAATPTAPEVAPTEESADEMFDAAAITGSAIVTGTNGDGVRCRAAGSFDAEVLTVLPEGAAVDLRGSAGNGWQPVVCGGRRGFVATDFLTASDDGGQGGDDGGDGAEAILAIIRGTNGDGVRCRSQASFDSSIISVLPEGSEVTLRGDQTGEWQPVTCVGARGFVHADFVGQAGDGDDGGGSNSGLRAGDAAAVAGTNGDGVRFRARAGFDGAVIAVVREGQGVTVVEGSRGDWVAVDFRGDRGFIHMDFLVPGGGGDDGGDGALGRGAHARVSDTLRLRDGASFLAEVLSIANPGTVVEITGPSIDGFYPVSWDGLDGFMHGDFLSWTDEPLSSRDDVVGGDAGSGAGSALGRQIVDYARRYLGYPYIWATHGPESFDCSGFTYWVYLHVAGQDITAGTWFQQYEGRPVAYGDLQPGDLVFFQNTYTFGLSHVGIYIGNNQFIHAESEDTGVVISSLTSPYYANRWYGARRLL